MTLHERIQLLVTAFLVILALTAIASAVAVGQRDALVAEDATFNTAREQVSDILTAFVDQQAGVHSYVITQDPVFLEPYESGRAAADNTLAELRQTIEDADPQLTADVDRIEAAAQEWQTRAAERKIE